MNKKILFSGLNAVLSRLKAIMTIIDTFTRGNQSGLGTISNNTWSTIRGSWGISGNAAVNAGAASDYPISTLTFGTTSPTLGVVGGPGVGTAFWVTDSNNWWATYQDVTQNCQTCYNTNVCTAYYMGFNGNIAGYSVYSELFCPSNSCSWWANNSGYKWGLGGGGVCGDCGSGQCCYHYVSSPYYNSGNYFYYCGAYSGSNPYSCNCSNSYSIKLIKSIAGSISTVATFSLGGIAASFKTIVNGSSGAITVRGYTNSNYTTQTGADGNTTATGFTATKKHGMIASPVTYAAGQTSSATEFRVG